MISLYIQINVINFILGIVLMTLREGGVGGSESSVTMTLSVQILVWRCPLSVGCLLFSGEIRPGRIVIEVKQARLTC